MALFEKILKFNSILLIIKKIINSKVDVYKIIYKSIIFIFYLSKGFIILFY